MIRLPLFMVETQDPTVLCFRSVEEAADWLEPIDVENGEYRAWDAQGDVVHLEVVPGAKRWLRAAETGRHDPAGLLSAVRTYAAAVGLELDESLTKVSCEVVARVDEAAEAAKRAKRHWYRFWRRD